MVYQYQQGGFQSPLSGAKLKRTVVVVEKNEGALYSLPSPPRFDSPTAFSPSSRTSERGRKKAGLPPMAKGVVVIPAPALFARASSSSSSSSSSGWFDDKGFLKSKVFGARLNKAATNIQSLVRSYLARVRYQRIVTLKKEEIACKQQINAVVRLQSNVRRQRAQRIRRCIKAAVLIQKVFRGWHTYMTCRLSRLQGKLQQIASLKQEQLCAIERDLERDKGAFREEMEGHGEEDLKRTQKFIRTLQRKNRKLRIQNEEYREQCAELRKENAKLQKSILATKCKMEKLSKEITSLTESNRAWTDIVKRMKAQANLHSKNLEISTNKLAYETKIGKLYHQELRNMMIHIGGKSCDRRIVFDIESILKAESSNDKNNSEPMIRGE